MPTAARKDGVIQIRAPRDAKALIMRAAELKHQKLSEFMLDSARRSAEETILDSNLLHLTKDQHDAFVALLDAQPAMADDVKRRYARKPAWEA